MTTSDGATYLNPVYTHDFPDPYVFKFRGEYWAYCTGLRPDGRAFGVMHSRDLVHWRELPGALTPLAGNHPCYWAPEVVYRNGRCLMYYSVGNEKLMHIRVATAAHPAGPFEDSGHELTHAEFAIDPHVYVADDGTRWLFYATDFLTYTHIGTGTVRDRLLDDFTLAGEPRPITRARYDWQVYDPQRAEKGGVRWHTVEGPFVLKHKGRLYQMFSGGNWQNVTYGVSYALSDTIERADEWEQVADGERVLPILRTIPGEVIGPGHNSVVRGPDNRQLFCVYHRWLEGEGRVLAIDRLDWIGERMTVLGPSTTPQPAPYEPACADYFDEDRAADLGDKWTTSGGRWSVRNGAARQEATEATAQAQCNTHAESFVVELNLRALQLEESMGGAFGVRLERAENPVCKFVLVPQSGQAVLSCAGAAEAVATFLLPAEFDQQAFHQLRVEVDRTWLCVVLDDCDVRWQGYLPAAPDRIALLTEQQRAAFAGFALTVGWADLFTDADWQARGWQATAGDATWRVSEQELRADAAGDEPQVLCKGALLDAYELVINARLDREAAAGGVYGFYPAFGAHDERGPLLTVERAHDDGWLLVAQSDDAQRREFQLPQGFDPYRAQQFRVRKAGGQLQLQCEATPLGTIAAPTHGTRIGLYAHGAGAAFDLVRVTEIKKP